MDQKIAQRPAVIRDDTIAFLQFLRAVACLLVVYSHWIGRGPSDWIVRRQVEKYVIDPLGLVWNFGYLGVAVFFVISGFIICHIAQRERRASFAAKRFARILPPFWVALIFALVVGYALHRPAVIALTPLDVLSEASLFNSTFVILGPSYTLAIEIIFYAIAFAMLPLLRTAPRVSVAIVAIVLVVARLLFSKWAAQTEFRPVVLLFQYLDFIPVFAIGMAIYYAAVGRMSVRWSATLCLAAWIAHVLATGPGLQGRGFQSNSLYAVVIFLAALWASSRWTPSRAWLWIGERSYGAYLLHAPLGALVITLMMPVLAPLGSAAAFICALLLALVALVVLVELFYRFVETPSRRLARRRPRPDLATAPG